VSGELTEDTLRSLLSYYAELLVARKNEQLSSEKSNALFEQLQRLRKRHETLGVLAGLSAAGLLVLTCYHALSRKTVKISRLVRLTES
jgi:hypothetical protein